MIAAAVLFWIFFSGCYCVSMRVSASTIFSPKSKIFHHKKRRKEGGENRTEKQQNLFEDRYVANSVPIFHATFQRSRKKLASSIPSPLYLKIRSLSSLLVVLEETFINSRYVRITIIAPLVFAVMLKPEILAAKILRSGTGLRQCILDTHPKIGRNLLAVPQQQIPHHVVQDRDRREFVALNTAAIYGFLQILFRVLHSPPPAAS